MRWQKHKIAAEALALSPLTKTTPQGQRSASRSVGPMRASNVFCSILSLNPSHAARFIYPKKSVARSSAFLPCFAGSLEALRISPVYESGICCGIFAWWCSCIWMSVFDLIRVHLPHATGCARPRLVRCLLKRELCLLVICAYDALISGMRNLVYKTGTKPYQDQIQTDGIALQEQCWRACTAPPAFCWPIGIGDNLG